MKVDFTKLERAFYPKSIAVVGDKSIIIISGYAGRAISKANFIPCKWIPRN